MKSFDTKQNVFCNKSEVQKVQQTNRTSVPLSMHDFHLYAHTYTKRMHVHVCNDIMIEYELLQAVSSMKRLFP